ncbi:uncharacterized protein JCM15063_001224 [Sporobolomyces koalae]|uniref:uncharacterized protein n=1 Tax=Sporobolomyces koalae TaxID=500713 RepID=UPI00317A362B
MRFFTSTLITAAAALSAAAQSTLTINTPSALFTCDPYLVTWSGGSAPYTVRVFPSGQLSATPLGTLVSGSDATSLTWTVNLAQGTAISLAITDSTGTTVPSAPVTVQAGTSTSCIGGAASNAVSTGNVGATSAQSQSASSTTSLSSIASSSASSRASSASSTVSSAATSASSAASSAAESASSRISTATAATGSAAASPTSGASSLAVSGALGVVGAAIAIFA